jgi:chemotaxis protein MotB
MRTILFLITFVLSLTGVISCVSKSKYETDMNQYEEKLKSKNDELKLRNESLLKSEANIKDLDQKLLVTSKDRGQLKANLDDLNKALEEMKIRREQEQKTIQEFKDLTAKFKTLTESGTLSVRIESGKMMVSLGSDILFASGSSSLSEEGRKTIREIAKKLAEIPEKTYQVEGHTDNIPIKTVVFPSNWELASARAISVLKTLIDGGLSADRISAASFAETHSVVANDSSEGRARNRRIEIVIVPNLANLPGYEELQKYSK